MEQKKILLIEDDEFLSDMYKTKFDSEGFSVTLASDGEAGLDILKGGLRPDAVLLDVVMPKMNGMEVLQKIKELEDLKDINVIMFTNMGQKEDMEKAKALGAAGYIVKANFTPSEVVLEVNKILSNLNNKQ